jgi:MFS transporter, PAT family, beta-lactamase induction signal transducer AmpG
MTLAESRLLRFVTFTALYLAQGVPWGFITVGYVVMLTDLGLDNAEIGAAVGLAYLPWSFKVVWGPLLDAVPELRIGRRRPFIVASQLLFGLTLLALLFVDPREALPTVALLLFLNNTFASLQDVAVDAMAVDLLEEDERGRANSLMWAGKAAGVAIGGGGGTLAARYFGYEALFVGMTALVWAIMLLPLLVRERPPRPDDRPVGLGLLRLLWFLIPIALVGVAMAVLSEVEDRFADRSWVQLVPIAKPFVAVVGAFAAWPLVDRRGFAALRRSFSFSVPWWGVAVGVMTPAGYAMVGTVLTRTLRAEIGLSSDEIAALTGVVEPLAGVVGALIGGVLADRYGARRTIAGFMVGIAACMATWGIATELWAFRPFVFGWTVAFHGCIYAYNAASLGMYMSLSNPRISATHFAIFMASTNLTYAWTAPLGGQIADAHGVAPLFVVAAVLQLVTIVLLAPIDARRAARVYAAQP